MLDFVWDDGGRELSGRRGQCGDCMVRAIAITAGLAYETVYARAASMYAAAGYRRTGDADRLGRGKARGKPAWKVQEEILRDFGFARISFEGAKPTFTEAEAAHGPCIARTSRHFAALRDGALMDTKDWRTYDWQGATRQRKAASVWIQRPA